MYYKAWVVSTLAVLALVLPSLAADPDLFARLAVGQLILDTGVVTSQDPFAFTPKKPIWIDHEWFAGLVFRIITQQFDDAGLLLFRVIVICCSIGGIVWAAKIWNPDALKSIPGSALLYLGAVFSSTVWASPVRAQVFTYLFLPLVLGLLGTKSKKLQGLIPIIFAVWANAHGGFVVGLGLLGLIIGLKALERRRLKTSEFFLILCSVAATCITPYAPIDFWTYILHAISMSRPSIGEWRALPFFSFSALPQHLLLGLLLLGWFKPGQHKDWTRFIPVLIAIYFGYKHDRLGAVSWITSVILALPYLVSGLGVLAGFWPGSRVVLARSFVIVGVVLPIISLVFSIAQAGSGLLKLDYSNYPVHATQWLKDCGHAGKLLVDFTNGSFVLWKLYPKFQISIDGRYEEVYPDSSLELVAKALENDPEALALLEPDYALLPLGRALSDFIVVYQDQQFQVLARASSGSHKTLCSHIARLQRPFAEQKPEPQLCVLPQFSECSQNQVRS